MGRLDEAQELLLKKLEDADWDISQERLEELAEDMSNLFPSRDEALEFVESHASSLFDMMQEAASRRASHMARRPPMPHELEDQEE
jgi:hypothetical protein